MSFSLEIFGASIVLVGNFNPAIFTPDWLESHQLIGPADAKNARENANIVISHQVTRLETEWFLLQVIDQQFSITSKGNVSDGLKDLVIGIFSLLSHTPARAIGINTTAHFKIDTEENYQKIGNVLAPKPIWHSIFDKSFHLGMETIAIRVQLLDDKGKRSTDANDDSKLITVQPSALINNGVYFMINDHHNLEVIDNKNQTNAQMGINLLTENWNREITNNRNIFEKILNQAINS